MVGMPRGCPGDCLGSLGTSGTSRPDLCFIPRRLDRMSRWDRREISMGQTGHIDGMVAIQEWRCPPNFFMFIGFSLPKNSVCHSAQRAKHETTRKVCPRFAHFVAQTFTACTGVTHVVAAMGFQIYTPPSLKNACWPKMERRTYFLPGTFQNSSTCVSIFFTPLLETLKHVNHPCLHNQDVLAKYAHTHNQEKLLFSR